LQVAGLNVEKLQEALTVLADVMEWQRTAVVDDVDLARDQARVGRPIEFELVAHRLVANLEYVARYVGGGFTLDRGSKKGRLIYALDALRSRLMQEQEWKWIAKFLPPRGCHPVATYERSLAEARRTADKHRQEITPDDMLKSG
jgi:hypothetical protein